MVDKVTDPATGGAVNMPDPAADPKAAATANPAETADPKPAEETGKPDAEKTGEGEGEPAPRPVSRAALRIRELAREKNQLRSERDSLQARLDSLSRPLPGSDKLDELDYNERETLRVRSATREERKEEIKAQINVVASKELQAAAAAVITQLEEANDPALKPIMEDPDFPISDDIIEFLAESDQAVAIAKHLSANQEVARRLRNLTTGKNVTRASMREFDRIMLELQARFRQGTGTKPQRKAATTAPAPGTTLNGGTPPPPLSLIELAKKSENASDYIKAREKAWASGGR